MPISGEYCKKEPRERMSTGFVIRRCQVQNLILEMTLLPCIDHGKSWIPSFLNCKTDVRKLTSNLRLLCGQ